ncbi:hypothetical protein EV356DRAFT_106644 [Viridothelium virens]|uniref:Uncharacterized protein n=1 Tax=Viridothelium virens TaxID=1048519 RepID=A0A6A6HNS9_VIRVR|nr:hypothetical protein EV356DRAFT_106644 [Viridothelium virens]
MADVRSMLRAERTARHIDHEDAHYTPGGMLMCKVCELPIKSDALWPKHIQSKPHKLQAQRKRDNAIPAPSNKKRKAADEEESERKKSRPEELQDRSDEKLETEVLESEVHLAPAVTSDNQPSQEDGQEIDVVSAAQRTAAVSGTGPATTVEQTAPNGVDEAEWAAFEREVATPPKEPAPVSALNATATIEAAPMSAEEIAAQAREEANTQRERRAEELEAEKEDAARQLEEELDEMESYDERLKNLKEKREALRIGREENARAAAERASKEVSPGEDNEADSDDDEYDDEWDGWHMRVG